ncbi:GIY-YIG nuclease family protein [Candidatus Uhrbacteria bacterium]|nr:GIY-YIG nuclease family protein [Candidatus Uhrbacteria bacterium]
MQFYYTYVLLSLKDYKFYIGFSADLVQRVKDHQRGNNTSTAKRLPLVLIFYEAFLSKEDALRREAYFKTNKGKTTLRQMLRSYLAKK